MRRNLIAMAVATLIAGISMHAAALTGEMLAEEADDSVRLTMDPCPVPVLKVIPEGSRGFFRKAIVRFQGEEPAGLSGTTATCRSPTRTATVG